MYSLMWLFKRRMTSIPTCAVFREARKSVVLLGLGSVMVALGLIACGSGGGSSGNSTLPGQNIAPVANAQFSVAGSVVNLSAAGSSDANGDSLQYAWALSKPANSSATLSNATAFSPTFVPDVPGLYTATLVVNDGKVSSPQALVALTAGTTVTFDSISPLPPNVASVGFQAASLQSLGDRIALRADSPRVLHRISIVMSSWACETGAWNTGCTSADGATFNHPITIQIFSSTGVPLSTVTQTFSIPYRPASDPTCTGMDANKWKASNGICYNGFATTINFNFAGLGIVLPDEQFYYVLSYNTNTQGPEPLGATGPYDSLNVGYYSSSTPPAVGTDPDPGVLIINGTNQGGNSFGIRARVEVIQP
jgi:hypothetical protein